MSLQGKIALITGASRGIGRACALELARRGADIAVNYRKHRREAENVAREVEKFEKRSIVVQADVSKRVACRRLIEVTVSKLGRLDVLVANAAASIRKPFLELTEEEMRFTLDVCLWGVFHCSQFAARQMVEQNSGGSIVVISSVHALLPFKNALPYNTAKAGINQMARTMANELARNNIRVNIVEPGWIDTPGERRSSTEKELMVGAQKLPFGRLGTSEEVAKGVAYLVSDDAGYVTGSTLRIDGGFVFPRPEL